jgi:tetratricopeptide (TPR) repeat protein
MTLEEVIVLCKSGVSVEVILESIRRDPAPPRPNPSEVSRLRKAGVPEPVIAVLLRGGPGGPKTAPRPTDARKRQDEERKEASEKLREEAERLRQEARRLAKEARSTKARTEQVAGRVKTELNLAFRDLRRGRSFAAISRFQSFMRSGLVQPNSYAYLEASFGLGLAFRAAEMPHSAAHLLVEVIRRGPQTPRFEESVTILGALMDQIDFVHPVLALLAEFEREVAKKPRGWLDEYNYLLGEFYDHYENAPNSMRHFSRVSTKSRRYAAARYHLGVLHTEAKKPRTAVSLFREALRRAEGDRNQGVVELASLALARLAFEVGSYTAAAHFYRRVPRASRHFARAQYELAWTQVMSERYQEALGTIHGLQSPFLRQVFAPDRLVLEAATYLNLCRTKEATQALARWSSEIGPGLEKLRSLLEGQLKPGALLKATQSLAAKRPSALPLFALQSVIADLGVYRAHSSLTQLEVERKLAIRNLAGPIRDLVVSGLDKRLFAFRERLDLELRRRLRDVIVELDGLKVKADEIGLEVELAEKSRLEEERRAIAAGQKVGPEDGGRRTQRLRVGSSQQSWPFDGEYWLDELGGYRSALRSACPKTSGPDNRKSP